MSDAQDEGYSQNYRRREYAARYLSGDGIEIGGLHNPLDVSGLPVARIRRVDRYDIAALREHYPPLHAMELVSVDIIDDGQTLATIPDASLDFIVANHLIEHCDNPLGTLGNWLAKLKTGGIIFMAVPDKRVGFEEQRPLTPLDHIVEDYRCDGEARTRCNHHHYGEWVDYFTAAFPADSPLTREERIHQLIAADYSIHFHVFTFESFRDLIVYCRDVLGLPLNIVDAARPMRGSWESLFILAKRAGDGPPAHVEAPDRHAGEAVARLEARRYSLRQKPEPGKLWRGRTTHWPRRTHTSAASRRASPCSSEKCCHGRMPTSDTWRGMCAPLMRARRCGWGTLCAGSPPPAGDAEGEQTGITCSGEGGMR